MSETRPWMCPWCVEIEVPAAGQLCVACTEEPDAVEFKAAHDAQCSCVAATGTDG